jgi:hypothetical protein
VKCLVIRAVGASPIKIGGLDEAAVAPDFVRDRQTITARFRARAQPLTNVAVTMRDSPRFDQPDSAAADDDIRRVCAGEKCAEGVR